MISHACKIWCEKKSNGHHPIYVIFIPTLKFSDKFRSSRKLLHLIQRTDTYKLSIQHFDYYFLQCCSTCLMCSRYIRLVCLINIDHRYLHVRGNALLYSAVSTCRSIHSQLLTFPLHGHHIFYKRQ